MGPSMNAKVPEGTKVSNYVDTPRFDEKIIYFENSCERLAILPQMEKRHDPRETKAITLIPAGRSACLRSQPISAPNSVAKMIRRPNEHSSGVKYSSLLCLV